MVQIYFILRNKNIFNKKNKFKWEKIHLIQQEMKVLVNMNDKIKYMILK